MSTSSGGTTELDLLKADYEVRWVFEVDGQGMISAVLKDASDNPHPPATWAWDAASLRRKLESFEVRFTTGDLP